MAQQVFGASVLGTTLFGGGSTQHAVTAAPIQIQYTTSQPTAKALTITYAVQMTSQNALTIGYWTALPTLGFTINGVTVPGPQHMVYAPRVSVGTDVEGIDLIQGSTTVTWQYDVLIDSEIAKLMAFFNPRAPQVTITYPNELGFWVRKTAYFQNFAFGDRATVLHNSVALTFTGIQPD